MPSSIVKREKLIGPVQLVLIGVLFAVSFLFLLPKQDAFIIGDIDASNASNSVIGELDIAYLKARSASGEQSLDETSRAVVALVRTGQVDAARELLEDRPDIDIAEKDRFSLDLEMASVEYFSAVDQSSRQLKRLQLLNLVELLISKPQLRSLPQLQRAAQLSEQLEKPNTAVELFKLLAIHDEENASSWYSKCAHSLAAQKQHDRASDCFEQAIQHASSAETIFNLKLDLLTQVSIIGNEVHQDSILQRLAEHEPLSNAQRESLAEAMLANQRPDQAHLIYKQLAQFDTTNQVKWLTEAAKWAQASNKGISAASYLDQAADISEGDEKNTFREQAERLLVAAGESKVAFTRLSQRIDDNPKDEPLLQEGIVLARQLGEVDKATQWNEQLVNLNPTSLDAIDTQIELALANSDLPSALVWSKHAVTVAPDSSSAHMRYARVLEWSGDPIGAQREWEWLAERYPEQDNLIGLVRLAELNRETDVAVEALHKLVLMLPEDDQKIARLVKLYELEGTPLRAADLLKELQQGNGIRAFNQRELARLYQRHVLYPEALREWNVFAKKFGRSIDETLNRMELSWRLGKPSDAADIAQFLVGKGNASEASQFQVHLISEIAWRYRKPELAELVRPHMAEIEDEYETVVLGKRLVQSLEDAGKNKQAIAEATRLWQTTRSNDVAFSAMNLAYKTGNTKSVSPFLANNAQTAKLRNEPDYWTLAASLHQRNGQSEAAFRALNQALVLDPSNVEALSGLLWSYIDAQDTNAIAAFIEKHQSTAETEPNLWSAFAIAFINLGLPELSLTWFDRQLDRIEADYNMLLTYADALEYAGQAEPARKIRLYTIKRLRPALAQGSRSDQDELIRQYSQLLNRYGTAEDKERQARLMLRNASNAATDTAQNNYNFWREDIAISWLMATQRHEQARLVMAKLHERRLQAPAWQNLAVAMANNDVEQIQQVINGTGSVSIGNHILALRQLGQDKEAYTVANKAINNAPTLSDRAIARSQFGAMRSERPTYSSGIYRQTTMNGLNINESGLRIRHTFDSMNLGLAIDYKKRTFASDQYVLTDNETHQDIALTLIHGDRRFGGSVSAGYVKTEAEGMPYALAKQHVSSLDGNRTLSAEVAYNEPSTASALLRLAAKQNRVTLDYEQSLGFREYVKLQGVVNDITTRVQEKRIARGLAARMELGIRGAFGSNVWSTSIAANRAENDVVSSLPDELALSPTATIGTVLADKSTSLMWGASLSRGGVQGEYPQASSPRYYLNANVGHTWPDARFGAQFDAGAGIRVLGGDELSIGFTHDTQPLNSAGKDNDSTSVGVNYRYHF